MRIASSTLYERSASQMTKLTAEADKLTSQISTKTTIATASDAPLAWTRLAGIKQANTDGKAWDANVSLAQSLVSQSDAALGQIQTQIQRAQELAVQANTGVLSQTDKASIATELKSILSDIAGLANAKDVRGQPLFGGASGDSAVSVASDGTVSITGTGTPPAIPIGEGSTIQPTDSAEKVFGGVAGANGPTDLFSALSNLISKIESGANISDASTDLTSAADQVTNARASIGARGNRLDIEAETMRTASDDREVLRGSLEDTDIASAITDLQKTMTILSATQASFTKLSSLSLFNYIN